MGGNSGFGGNRKVARIGRWLEQMSRWLDLVFACVCFPLEETVGSHQKSHCVVHPQIDTDTDTLCLNDLN